MPHFAHRALAAAVALAIVAPAFVQAADRTADVIVKEIEAINPPKDRAGAQKKVTLIGELTRVAPEDARLVKLLPERWSLMLALGRAEDAVAEVDATLAETRNPELKKAAIFQKAQVALLQNRRDPEAAMPAVEEFLKLDPKDERAVQLLSMMLAFVGNRPGPEAKAKARALEDRILRDYPDSSRAGMIVGERRRTEAIGKPLDLEFADAIKGETVSIKGLKGKVVVLDFWATWCGPCIAEMPQMKELYARLKPRGVEFIGVSLDEPKEDGGLEKLKKFVAEKEIPWPQYYQGKGWESAFSMSWGIDAIPCVFVIDAEGKLQSTDARIDAEDKAHATDGRKNLEAVITELLEKRDKSRASAGGSQ